MTENVEFDSEMEDKVIERFKKKTIEYLTAFGGDEYFALKIYALLLAAKEIASGEEFGLDFLKEAFYEVLSKD